VFVWSALFVRVGLLVSSFILFLLAEKRTIRSIDFASDITPIVDSQAVTSGTCNRNSDHELSLDTISLVPQEHQSD
jgi:hypothetical protein